MTKNVLRGAARRSLTGDACSGDRCGVCANPIKLGVLEDQSGDFAVATIGKVHAIQLAAEEINRPVVSTAGRLSWSPTTPSPTTHAIRNSCGVCSSATRST